MNNKRLFYLKSGLFIVLGILISAVSFSQSAANFSGSWSLNESKSNLGDGGNRMTSQKITIKQDAMSFSIERAFAGQDGTERKMVETYTLDGKESVNPVFNTTKKSTAAWSTDKKVLTVGSILVFEMNGESLEIKTVDIYKLTDNGKSLSVDTKSTSSRGDREAIFVYDKN